MAQKTTLVHWFRNGLRVHDNPGLVKVFELANSAPGKHHLRPIYILDPDVATWARIGANRWRFLQQTLKNLDAQLKKLNTRLYVLRGRSTEVLPALFDEWHVELLCFEKVFEPNAQARDAKIMQSAQVANVCVYAYCAHTIYDPADITRKNGGNSPRTYQKFMAVAAQLQAETPLDVPAPLRKEFRTNSFAKEHAVPELEELVTQPAELGPNKFPGGETEALRRMAVVLQDKQWVGTFEKPKTAPTTLQPSTTALSAYLSFGCLSARLLYRRINDVLSQLKQQHTEPPVSLLGQLLWREFYYAAAAVEPNFDRMMGNSYCMQIPWQINQAHLDAWTHGRTGYPFIDAIMRQLRQEGWIHHLARHAVACFLTRGDLWISWEYGQRVFEELLLDHDWALNAGNWMWLSASAFFYKYFRVYSPVAFGKKTDPTGVYIRKYVPELASYPAGTIYEPWKVARQLQQQYNCIIGQDYPERIVIHESVHKENIKRMTEAYRVNREVRTGKAEATSDATPTPTPTPTAEQKRALKDAQHKRGTSKRRKI